MGPLKRIYYRCESGMTSYLSPAWMAGTSSFKRSCTGMIEDSMEGGFWMDGVWSKSWEESKEVSDWLRFATSIQHYK